MKNSIHVPTVLALVSVLLMASVSTTSCTSYMATNVSTPAVSTETQSGGTPVGTEATPTPTGPAAPEFTVVTITGEELSLSDLRGKVVLLNFWATWCSTCHQERPYLQSVYEKYGDEGFVVVAIATDGDVPSVVSYTTEKELTFPTAVDTEGSLVRDYKVQIIPVSFFITREGTIHVKYRGPLTTEKIEHYLSALL